MTEGETHVVALAAFVVTSCPDRPSPFVMLVRSHR